MIELRSQAARKGFIASRPCRTRAACVLCLGLLGGCGATVYSIHVVRAARTVEQAKQVGAELSTPFEMTLAQAYLDKAREESAEASYQDATHLAERAQAIAEVATERARNATRGAGN